MTTDYDRIAEIGRLRKRIKELERERDIAFNNGIQAAADTALETPLKRDVVAEILKLFR
jgi:hypothetical protein